MIEYPSIDNSSKAPRQPCIAYNKLDGSNFRAKWTHKKGFCVYGSRTELIDETTENFGDMVKVFKRDHLDKFSDLFSSMREAKEQQEVIVYGEYFGSSSFAGTHDWDEDHKIIWFDILLGKKNRKFMRPQDFIKFCDKHQIDYPEVVYKGNLNEEFIEAVRRNDFNLNEGVVCKGTEPRGDYRGGIWSCKIKTRDYFDRLKERGETFVKSGWE